MSVSQRIKFSAKPGRAGHLEASLSLARSSLRWGGYVLGDGLTTFADREGDHASLIGHFVTKSAFAAAYKRAEEAFEFQWKFIQEDSVGEPEVIPVDSGIGIPTCRCSWKSKVPLHLWCTPKSMAPPLLCSEGGSIPFYRLELRHETAQRLWDWDERVRYLALLFFQDVSKNPNELAEWACEQLYSKDSWVSKESVELATIVEDETGREVRAFCPPVHMMKL